MCILELTPKGHVSKRDWITCSKYANHSRLNNQQDWENVVDHSMCTRIFNLIMDKLFLWAPIIVKQMTTETIWFCLSSHTNWVFHILREADVERKVSNISIICYILSRNGNGTAFTALYLPTLFRCSFSILQSITRTISFFDKFLIACNVFSLFFGLKVIICYMMVYSLLYI